jgi:hypothetical protein
MSHQDDNGDMSKLSHGRNRVAEASEGDKKYDATIAR